MSNGPARSTLRVIRGWDTSLIPQWIVDWRVWTVHQGRTSSYLRRLPVSLAIAARATAGLHRVAARCLEVAAVQSGDCVLDVGCGPAAHLATMPAVRYFGFDQDERAIAYARHRFGDRGEFAGEPFSELHLPDLPPVDVVLLVGMLRRLDDEECLCLLDVCARALGPGGRVVSVDPCFDPGPGRLSRWLAGRERDGTIRAPYALAELAYDSFTGVHTEVLTGLTRMPSAFFLMRLHTPIHSLAHS
jgi:SAM-dependent methyltransferase